MKTRLYYTFVVGTAIAMGNLRVPAHAHNQPAVVAATDPKAPTPAQRALALLKPAADRLSSAKAFTFKTHSIVAMASPTGQTINYSFNSEVAVQRPNKLVSKNRGDGPAFDLYYDGRTFSRVDEKLGLYAQINAPASLDELIPLVRDKTGIYFPSADMLYSDLCEKLPKDLTHAYWVGKSTVAGVGCDHLAFAAPGVEWQIWVGPKQAPLPRRLMAAQPSGAQQPRFMVTFSDWDLEPALSAERFEFKKPLGAKQTEFPALVTGNRSSLLVA